MISGKQQAKLKISGRNEKKKVNFPKKKKKNGWSDQFTWPTF